MRALARYGIAPRHLRTFRTAADREVGLLEQLVAPALRSRNPERREAGLEDLQASPSSPGAVELLFGRDVCGDSSPGRSDRRSQTRFRPRRSRDIPGFPRPGILFGDIMPLLADPARCGRRSSSSPFGGTVESDLVLGTEAAASSSARRGLRARRRLRPGPQAGQAAVEDEQGDYDLEYGTDALEIHADAVATEKRILIHDDLLATGGTARAKVELVEKLGGKVVGAAFIIELPFLHGRKKLEGYDVHSLIEY